MATWPCSNPSCKSNGTPHPNCRCPAPMAEGGKPQAYCSTDRKHLAGCEYFAEGGTTGLPEGFTLDKETSPSDMPEGFTLDEDHEEKPSNSALAGVEGAARQLTFGASDAVLKGARSLAEQYSDDPDFWAPKTEDVSSRKETTAGKTGEAIGLGAGLLGGAGAPALISKGTNAAAKALGLAEAQGLAKIGSTALKTAVESGLYQASDEVSKAILDQPGGNPSDAVANLLAAGSMGALFGAGAGTLGVGLNKVAETKYAKDGVKFLADFGKYWNNRDQAPAKDWFIRKSMSPNQANTPGAKFAKKLYGDLDNYSDKIIRRGAELVGAGEGGLGGYLTAKIIEPALSKVFKRPISKMGEYGVSAVVKVLGEGDASRAYQALEYARSLHRGDKMMNKALDSIFQGGTHILEDATDKDTDKINKWIEKGGANQELAPQASPLQQFAEGGEVGAPQDVGVIAKHWPVQDTLINASKGRVSQYLMSLKPDKNAPRLAFDHAPNQAKQEKNYQQALRIAAKPLSILQSVKNGELSLSELKHLTQMYPEIYNVLGKRISQRLVDGQMNGEKPSRKVRQSLSLFIGAPLNSSMTPMSIQSAQAVFQANAQQRQGQADTKRGTSTLGKSNAQYKTPDQAAQADKSTRK